MFSLLRKNYFNKLSKQLLVAVEATTDLNGQQGLKTTIRALSTFNYSTTLAAEIVYNNDRREFMAVFPDLVRNLTEYASKYQSKDAVKLYEKALQYNVTTGKHNLGFITVQIFKNLASKDQLNSENIKLAQYLGWCFEMVLSSAYIIDDIQDGSVTRSGKPCWYKQKEVGLTAINDSLMILNGIYHILKENFGQKDYYVKLLEVFHEVFFIVPLGQSLDLQASKIGVTSFTMDRYKSIVKNKTCVGLHLTTESAIHLCGLRDPEIYRQSREILYELGYLFQIQDDFNDCFGDPEITGKIGTDIQENKCSWLAVVCMEKASDAEKEIMQECYGKTDPIKIAQVKHLYRELGLPNIYTAFKKDTINMFKTRIQQDSGNITEHLLRTFLPIFTSKNL